VREPVKGIKGETRDNGAVQREKRMADDYWRVNISSNGAGLLTSALAPIDVTSFKTKRRPSDA
jgi:hypothetical protein